MESTVRDKSKMFAIRIVKLYRYLCDEKKEWVLSKQLLRSGTSIGANIVEAQAAVSRKDFLAKMYVSFKECCETEYWLELLHETGYLTNEEFESINQDNITLKKMLSSITYTTSNNLKKDNS
jgi:four helix bundle protein